MASFTVIKNSDFQLISEFAQPDAKKRLSLGEAVGGATAYNCASAVGVNLSLRSMFQSIQILDV